MTNTTQDDAVITTTHPDWWDELDTKAVDTARLLGQSVYGSIGSGISDQLSAMPSVHIGWSVLIGWYAVRLGHKRADHAVTAMQCVRIAAEMQMYRRSSANSTALGEAGQ